MKVLCFIKNDYDLKNMNIYLFIIFFKIKVKSIGDRL